MKETHEFSFSKKEIENIIIDYLLACEKIVSPEGYVMNFLLKNSEANWNRVEIFKVQGTDNV